jgi:hypothetical protein
MLVGPVGNSRGMVINMDCVILRNYGHYVIVNDDANIVIGRAQPLNGREGPYRVSAELVSNFENSDVAIVGKIQEAIPALVAYYKRYPPVWEHRGSLYIRDTQFAVLQVQHGATGDWIAYRNGYPLLCNGKLAFFSTSEDAQSAADAHLRDMFPNFKPVYDGLSWLPDPDIDWRSSPQLVEDRAVWQHMASQWLPDCDALKSTRLKVLQGGKT